MQEEHGQRFVAASIFTSTLGAISHGAYGTIQKPKMLTRLYSYLVDLITTYTTRHDGPHDAAAGDKRGAAAPVRSREHEAAKQECEPMHADTSDTRRSPLVIAQAEHARFLDRRSLATLVNATERSKSRSGIVKMSARINSHFHEFESDAVAATSQQDLGSVHVARQACNGQPVAPYNDFEKGLRAHPLSRASYAPRHTALDQDLGAKLMDAGLSASSVEDLAAIEYRTLGPSVEGVHAWFQKLEQRDAGEEWTDLPGSRDCAQAAGNDAVEGWSTICRVT